MSKTNGKTHSEKTTRKPYEFDTFVKNWQKATNIAEVVAATGLTRNTVSAMSTKLRKEGVKLKMMPRRVARVIDVKALNRLITE